MIVSGPRRESWGVEDYRKLAAWRQAHAFTLQVYSIVRNFPFEERFGLTAQLRRAALSIGANIVEGRARATDRAFALYLEQAGASAAESEYLLLVAHDVGYLTADDHELLERRINSVRRLLAALRARVLASALRKR